MVGKNLAEDSYERLANAIILSAVSDYRAALKRINNISKVVSKVSRPTKGRLLYYSIFGGSFG